LQRIRPVRWALALSRRSCRPPSCGHPTFRSSAWPSFRDRLVKTYVLFSSASVLQIDTADTQIYVISRRCGEARRCLALLASNLVRTNLGSTSHAASCQRTASLLLTALFNAQAASRSGASWTSLRIEGAPDVSDRALLACGAKAPRLRQLALVGLSGVTVRGLTSFMTTTSLESLELADLQALDGGEVRIFVAELSRGVSGGTLAFAHRFVLLDDLDAICAATCTKLGLTSNSMISG